MDDNGGEDRTMVGLALEIGDIGSGFGKNARDFFQIARPVGVYDSEFQMRRDEPFLQISFADV